MYILKGFMSMPSLAADGKNEIAEFGEFSTYCQTFTRDMRNYAISAQPDVELFVLKSIDELESRTNPSAGFRSILLGFGQWVFNQLIAGSIPPDRNKPAFIQSIQTQFPTMSAISIGAILESTKVAGRNCPDYVQFKMLDGTNQYQVTLWFADESFREQYDEYEIFVVPPVPDINQLINDKVNVVPLIQGQTADLIINRVQEITGDLPHTALYSYKLTWHDPNDFNAVYPTAWTAIIYGAAGYDNEAIKEKIRDYIEEHSDYEHWNQIYPDLYAETEFSFFPLWADLALQSNAQQVGIYSSLVGNKKSRDVTKTFLPSGYSQAGVPVDTYLDAHLFNGVAFYRTLSFTSVGNPNNKNAIRDVQQLYPDINFNLDTLSNDFGRMTLESQELSRKFNAALNVAREFKPSDVLAVGYTRMVRRGMHFIAFNYLDYNYIILTKYSFYRTLGIQDSDIE